VPLLIAAAADVSEWLKVKVLLDRLAESIAKVLATVVFAPSVMVARPPVPA
jgi:hypothetical protein